MSELPVWLVLAGFAAGIIVAMLMLCDTFDGE